MTLWGLLKSVLAEELGDNIETHGALSMPWNACPEEYATTNSCWFFTQEDPTRSGYAWLECDKNTAEVHVRHVLQDATEPDQDCANQLITEYYRPR